MQRIKFCCRSVLLTLGLSLVHDVGAAPSFRANKKYPELGLSLRTLGGAVPEPLPPHKTYAYTITRNGETTRCDLYDPYELWYATQHVGQWRDDNGNRLILGRASRLLPRVESDIPHVSREAFDAAFAAPDTAFDPSSPDALTTWLAAFSGGTLGSPEKVRTGFSLHDALCFPTDTGDTLVYAFRAKLRTPQGGTEPTEWFCAVIRIADGTPKAKVRKDFETQFLASVATLPRHASSGAGGQGKTLRTAPAGAVLSDHPGRAAARRSIANMKDWWYAETPDYIFLSDIRSSSGKALIKEIQTTLSALRTAFTCLVPPFEAETDVSVVRIFENAEAYRAYVGPEWEWSVGLWSPMRRELVILSQNKDIDRTLEIIRHEGFHQYLFHATRMIPHATWYNEGHACFCESAQVDSKGRVELTEGIRAAFLIQHLKEVAANLPAVLRADRSAFYEGKDAQRNLNYATAWGLVYFLRKGAPSRRLSAYSQILSTYLTTLEVTRDAEAATAAAFKGIDMTVFQKDFVEFWEKGRNSARRYDPLAASASSH
ncbi:MAG TPA: DUF1570 domain-containing protein [Kiritimatiellia bacterium]|nr:DUF1570 domain-containing protein [Kiritimatiellia bacterium]HRU71281.1 DUF1570 domain-containing protein [Kiritimatiellia bacterium]